MKHCRHLVGQGYTAQNKLQKFNYNTQKHNCKNLNSFRFNGCRFRNSPAVSTKNAAEYVEHQPSLLQRLQEIEAQWRPMFVQKIFDVYQLVHNSSMLQALLQTVCNVLFVALYVASSYAPANVGTWRHTLELLLCIQFGAEFVRRVLMNKTDRMQQLLQWRSLVELLSFIPPLVESLSVYLLGMDQWSLLDLRWFRVFRSLRVFRVNLVARHFTADQFNPNLPPTQRADTVVKVRLVQLACTIIMLLFAGASMVATVESMTWHQALYLVTTTLTTVGFGDVVPTTPLGRVAVLCVLLVGVVAIPVLSSQVYGQIMTRKSQLGSLNTNGRRTVLCCSKITEIRSFSDFFNEYSLRRPYEEQFNMVCLTNKPSNDARAFQELHDARLTMVEGSPLSEHDLIKVNAHKARSVLLLADRFSDDWSKEDTSIQFQVWMVKAYLSHIPCYVHVLQRSSLDKIIPFLNPKQDIIVSLQDIRLKMMAMGALYPGSAALVSNLCRPAKRRDNLQPKRIKSKSQWLTNYVTGCEHEMYVTRVTDPLVGQPFLGIAAKMMDLGGLVAMGIRRGPRNVHLNPGDYALKKKDSLIIIAKNREDVADTMKDVECDISEQTDPDSSTLNSSINHTGSCHEDSHFGKASAAVLEQANIGPLHYKNGTHTVKIKDTIQNGESSNGLKHKQAGQRGQESPGNQDSQANGGVGDSSGSAGSSVDDNVDSGESNGESSKPRKRPKHGLGPDSSPIASDAPTDKDKEQYRFQHHHTDTNQLSKRAAKSKVRQVNGGKASRKSKQEKQAPSSSKEAEAERLQYKWQTQQQWLHGGSSSRRLLLDNDYDFKNPLMGPVKKKKDKKTYNAQPTPLFPKVPSDRLKKLSKKTKSSKGHVDTARLDHKHEHEQKDKHKRERAVHTIYDTIDSVSMDDDEDYAALHKRARSVNAQCTPTSQNENEASQDQTQTSENQNQTSLKLQTQGGAHIGLRRDSGVKLVPREPMKRALAVSGEEVFINKLQGHVVVTGDVRLFAEFVAEIRRMAWHAVPVVLLSMQAIDERVLSGMRESGQTYHVCGPPGHEDGFAACNIQAARAVVYLSDQHRHLEYVGATNVDSNTSNDNNNVRSTIDDAVMHDSDALTAMYLANSQNNNQSPHTLVELSHTSSTRFLLTQVLNKVSNVPSRIPQKSPLARQLEVNRALGFEGLATWQANPYYCAGNVIVPACLQSVISQSFHRKSFLLSTLTQLWGDAATAGGGQLDQLSVSDEFVGWSYGEYSLHVMKELGQVPLGLYRQSNNGILHYVQTNPHTKVLLKPTDKVFVLKQRAMQGG